MFAIFLHLNALDFEEKLQKVTLGLSRSRFESNDRRAENILAIVLFMRVATSLATELSAQGTSTNLGQKEKV